MSYSFCLALLGGYLLGSVPFGLVLSLGAGLGDIRKIGSGNIGATNVLRTGNKMLAALTLLLDGAKGAVAVLIARHYMGHEAAIWIGLATFLGHIFPLYLNFKGGKGVATSVGVMLALSWPMGLCVMGIWIATVLLSRLSSLSALVALGSMPFLTFVFHRGDLLIVSILLALVVYYKHSENIRRLMAGTEPKIGQKKNAKK